ncbi:hypothetical protein [Nannocystis radixulma]|uniref:TIGR02270 family protein n=1 Tax=Nannocystis radixulma TaxID=2995305 RepID=A0ABT5B231_9BACT|nr:hypothetical protein [Nannocystis radixulma]MDC0668161.1 hypothetical protein [Nannocystis radixulma]
MSWNLAAHRRASEFAATFIDEHVDEMAFLLEHRLWLLHRRASRWPDAAPFEVRLAAHLDAWNVYGPGARARALEQVESVVHAQAPLDEDAVAASAFALGSELEAPDAAARLVAWIVRSPEALLPAWERGLRMAAGEGLDLAMHAALERAPPSIAQMLIATLGWRRQVQADVVLREFAGRPLRVQETIALALAKTGRSSAGPVLRTALARQPDSVALASALLALGDTTAWGHVRELASGRDPPPGVLRLLAMHGDLRDEELLRRAPDSVETLGAMGILGSHGLVPDLLRRLSAAEHEPALAGAAADALERIAGAGLREVVQANAAEDGAAPVERVARDPERWSAFFDDNASRFAEHGRYRSGRTFQPERCLDELAAPDSPFAWRTDAAEEWSLHTRRPMPFEPDSWVAAQRAALRMLGRTW